MSRKTFSTTTFTTLTVVMVLAIIVNSQGVADPAAEARIKALEEQVARLVNVEARLADLERAQVAKPATAGAQVSQRVRAPFEVTDVDGSVIFSVAIAQENQLPMAVLGYRNGANVRLLLNRNDGSSVGLYDGSGDLRIGMRGTATESFLVVRNGKHDALNLRGDGLGGTVTVHGGAGAVAGTLHAGKGGTGHFTLSRAQGDVIVEAGGTADGVGEVRTSGPGGGGLSTAPGLPPSFIRGWRR